MSKHWNPDEDLLEARLCAERLRLLDKYAPCEPSKGRRPLPPGSAAALILLGAACIAVAAGLYELIGPRDVFAQDSAADWSALDEVASRQRS